VYASSATSLSQLFRKAVDRIETEQGADAARRLLSEWRRLREDTREALTQGDRQAAQATIAALRAEEIRITRLVLGDAAIAKVIRDVSASLERVQAEWRQSSSGGKDVSRARSLASQVGELLADANAALDRDDPATALDRGTRASDMLDGLIHFLIALHRIPGLETIYSDMVARLGRERDAASVQALLSRVDQLDTEARDALRRGQRERARVRLEAVRKEQIRLVLSVQGPAVVTRLLNQVDASIALTRPQLAGHAEVGMVQRAALMLGEAASLNTRARKALQSGDATAALDLGSHAASMINALQHLLPR
jgi:hypothetical protein